MEERKKSRSNLAEGVFFGLLIAMLLAILLISVWEDIAPTSSTPEPTSTPTPVVKATATPTATVRPVAAYINAPNQVQERKRFVVTVNVSEVTNLDVAQYEITYDPEVIKVAEVNSGEIGETPILIDGWVFVPSEEQGSIQISNKAGGDSWASGSGFLSEIVFKVVGSSGATCAIEFDESSSELLDKDAKEIPATWSEASVSIE